MLVVDLHTNKYSDVDEREAFAMQLRGTYQLLHKNAEQSYYYAKDVLRGRFPLGEAAISTHEWWAYLYAQDVLRKPFPLGEAAIATDIWCSYYYAKDVLRGRFPLGEAVIIKDEFYSKLYAREFNLKLVGGVFQPC